ncbi:hypothetical protein QO002_004114 [Pararhizobium capsulatum DSM 1112]|uniref:Uncharacterized protein n=1 Tax=Pararhizobium capsulatum DSM 1112 TaxID=1121113 RepID=A0ABU0BUP2_9HYPH|nr:hypothetical protein [Pararhizobium capsulatum]MDQ0321976.1 hypothetical protein [Pararhizobium capsulatum DSM 1112]
MDFDHREAVQDHKHDRLDELGFGREGRRLEVTCAQCHKTFECWQTGEGAEPLCNECLFDL